MTLGPLDASRTHAPQTVALTASHAKAAPPENCNLRNVIPSAEPPLTARQVERLRQPGMTAVEYYEQSVPGLRDLRCRASDLVRATARLNPDDAAGNLRAAKRRMVLEGELLSSNPHLDFHDAGRLLDLNHTEVSAPRVLHADALNRLEDRLAALFNQTTDALPPHTILRSTLEQGLADIAKHLEGHEAFYHQVLQGELSDNERQYIAAGHRALLRLADRYAGAAERLIHQCHACSSERLQTAQADVRAAQALSASSNDHQARPVQNARNAVEHWQAVVGYFKKQASLFHHHGPLASALQHLRLDDHLESLHSARGGLFTRLLSAAGAGLPDGVASTLQFVLARAYLASDAHVLGLAAQSFANGSAIGVAHETLENFAKPAAQEIMSSLGMREPEPIDVKKVIPDAPRVTVVDGRYHERSDDQLAAAQNRVERARAGFRNAQQDYKTGTLKGDGLTFLNLSAAQMVRQVIWLNTHLDTSTMGPQALTSFSSKFVASFSQAQGQLNKTYHHEGRDLPTHIPTPAQRESLLRRLGQRAQNGLHSIDPRQRTARESYASKVWSGSEGMLVYHAVDRAIAKLDTRTLAGAACSVLLTGVQALGLQMPFEANKRSGDEAAADETGRMRSAVANIIAPNRETLAHGTQLGTPGRQAENLYNRARGIEQLPAQIATAITEAVAGAVVRGVSSALSVTTRQLINRVSLHATRPTHATPDVELGLDVGRCEPP